MDSIPAHGISLPTPPISSERRRSLSGRWWAPNLVLAAVATSVFVVAATSILGVGRVVTGSAGWWVLTAVLHVPALVILSFLAGGLVERFGFYLRGRPAATSGRLPTS